MLNQQVYQILKVTPSKERESQLSGSPVPNISRKDFLSSSEAAVATFSSSVFTVLGLALNATQPLLAMSKGRTTLVLYKLQLLDGLICHRFK